MNRKLVHSCCTLTRAEAGGIRHDADVLLALVLE